MSAHTEEVPSHAYKLLTLASSKVHFLFIYYLNITNTHFFANHTNLPSWPLAPEYHHFQPIPAHQILCSLHEKILQNVFSEFILIFVPSTIQRQKSLNISRKHCCSSPLNMNSRLLDIQTNTKNNPHCDWGSLLAYAHLQERLTKKKKKRVSSHSPKLI